MRIRIEDQDGTELYSQSLNRAERVDLAFRLMDSEERKFWHKGPDPKPLATVTRLLDNINTASRLPQGDPEERTGEENRRAAREAKRQRVRHAFATVCDTVECRPELIDGLRAFLDAVDARRRAHHQVRVTESAAVEARADAFSGI